MTIYGEFDSQFRKKPALWRLFLLGFSALVLASILVSLLVGAGIAVLGKANAGDTPSSLVLFAPAVVTGSSLLDSAMGTSDAFAWIAGAAALLAAIVVMFFWPSEPTVASQLVSNALGSALVVFGAMTLSIESILARWSYLDDPREVLGEIIVLVVAIVVALAGERKTVAFLANLVAMDAPARRVRLWLMRLGIPLALLGAAGWLFGSLSPALAAAAFLLVTFFENIARRPNALFVQLRDVQMKEAAATLPLLAIILLAASVWTFGAAPFRPHRALVWKGGNEISFAPPADAARQGGLDRPIPRESVIRMEWSKKAGEGSQDK